MQCGAVPGSMRALQRASSSAHLGSSLRPRCASGRQCLARPCPQVLGAGQHGHSCIQACTALLPSASALKTYLHHFPYNTFFKPFINPKPNHALFVRCYYYNGPFSKPSTVHIYPLNPEALSLSDVQIVPWQRAHMTVHDISMHTTHWFSSSLGFLQAKRSVRGPCETIDKHALCCICKLGRSPAVTSRQGVLIHHPALSRPVNTLSCVWIGSYTPDDLSTNLG